MFQFWVYPCELTPAVTRLILAVPESQERSATRLRRFLSSSYSKTLPSYLIQRRPRPKSKCVIAVTRRILVQISLVLGVGRVKALQVDNPCLEGRLGVFNLACRHQTLEFGHDLGGNLLLFLVLAKDDTPVLRSHVVTLTIERRGIVELKEKSHQGFVVGGRIVQFDHQDFDMSRGSGADLAVGGILHGVGVGAHETDRRRLDGGREGLLKVLDDKLFRAPVCVAG